VESGLQGISRSFSTGQQKSSSPTKYHIPSSRANQLEAKPPAQTATTDTAQTQETASVPVKRENIFASRGPQKVPFEFVRTSGGAKDPTVSGQPGFGLDFIWIYLDKYLPGLRQLPLTWPFKSCIEQQAVVDLPNLRLAVTSIQGFPSLYRNSDDA